MNWSPISQDNLPDSDTPIVVVHAEEHMLRLVYLELTDDSEGNAEPYWEDADDSSREYELGDFTHWSYYEPPAADPKPEDKP